MSNNSKPKNIYRKIYFYLFLIGLCLLIASSFLFHNKSTLEVGYREARVTRGDLNVSVAYRFFVLASAIEHLS